MNGLERLAELIESANGGDWCGGNGNLKEDECSILFDHGWSHGLDIQTRGFLLIEIRNTGWQYTEDREEAEALGSEG